MKISSNKVRCKKCQDILESADEKEVDWCSCGAVAISGGLTMLKRYGATYEDLDNYEELSKFEYDNPDSVEFL